MKKLMIAVMALTVVALAASQAQADGCRGPFCQPQPQSHGVHGLFSKKPLPAFQAAPWYLYWPYNAHFMTPDPLTGAYYAPPTDAGLYGNPYFPTMPYSYPTP